MRGVLAFFAALALTWGCLLMPAAASRLAGGEKRVALVIGNGGYRNVEKLRNAVGDADAIAGTLQKLGFTVTKGTDLDGAGFEATLAAFRAQAEGADAVLFYYSGHAFQLAGVNHLVPTDAALRSRDSIATETVSLDDIISGIQSPTRPTLIFLDACRNNPLPSRMRAAEGDGLARLQSNVANLYIAFATAPGAVTDDGLGERSPFAGALLKNMPRQGVSVGDMMIYVTDAVSRETLGRQQPWTQGSMSRVFYFNPRPEEAGSEAERLARADAEVVPSNLLLPSDDELPAEQPDGPANALVPDDAPAEPGPGPGGAAPRLAPSASAGTEVAAVRPAAPARPGRSGEAPAVDRQAPVLRSGPAPDAGAAHEAPALVAVARAPHAPEMSHAALAASGAMGGASAAAVRAVFLAPAAPAPRAQAVALLRIEGRDMPEPEMPTSVPLPAASPEPPDVTVVAIVRPDDVERDLPLEDDGEDGQAGLSPEPVPVVPAPQAPASAQDLARETQAELLRLGCYRGTIDGDWGSGSADALRRFFAESGAGPAASDPSDDILALLRAEEGVVCKAVVQKPEPPQPNDVEKPAKPKATGRVPRPNNVEKPSKPRVTAKPPKPKTVYKPAKPKVANRPPKPTVVKGPKPAPAAPAAQKPKLKLRGIGA